jgi:phage repressor protein C with HTH and peptisase S24 domain
MPVNNEPTQRIFEVIDALMAQKRIKSKAAFAIAIDLDPTVLSAAKANKRSIPANKYDAIAEHFGVNIHYIKKGELPMFSADKILDKNAELLPGAVNTGARVNARLIGDLQQNEGDSPFIDLGNGQYIMIVPLVQDYAYAGYLSGYSDEQYVEELPKHSFVVNKQHRGIYVAFQVIGDSMSNGTEESIIEGSVVTGREIQKHLWNSRFHIHRFKDYIIVHREGILIKRITKHDVDQGVITCHSLNPNKDAYPDFDLNLDDVAQIFNIVNVTQLR